MLPNWSALLQNNSVITLEELFGIQTQPTSNLSVEAVALFLVGSLDTDVVVQGANERGDVATGQRTGIHLAPRPISRASINDSSRR